MGKGDDMTDLTVEMRDLDEMVVVSGSGFGVEPEPLAWNLIFEFAALHGLEVGSGEHRFFGFNNPGPSPGNPDYGYEQWMTIDPGVGVEAPLTRKEIPRSRYVATRFVGLQNITDTWREFLKWFDDRGLERSAGDEPCLEELRNPAANSPELWEFDLYLPISEPTSV